MTAQQLIAVALQVSILLTVVGFGLRATVHDILYVVQRPRLFGRSLVAMFVIMPILAVGLARTFAFRDPVEIVIVALAISPIPPLLPGREQKSGGYPPFGIGLMVIVGLLSIVIVPLLVSLLSPLFARDLAVSTGAVAGLALQTTVLPLAAGLVLHALLPGVAARIATPVSRVANVLLMGSGLLVLIGALPAVAEIIGDGTVVALGAFIIAGLAVGHWLGGPESDHQVVLALSTASRHPAIALAIAKANFPDAPELGATVVLFLLINLLLGVPYVLWQRKMTAPIRSPGGRIAR